MLSNSALKTFVTERLGEAWKDPAIAKMQLETLHERAEPYALRVCPSRVRGLVVSVDTQDDRLECKITGWAPGPECWVLDYHVINGDPFEDAVWADLTDYCNTPLIRENAAQEPEASHLPVSATIIDAGGHRTHAVYAWCRSKLVQRPMAIFGAKKPTAEPLSRATPQDVKWRGQVDKQGVLTRQVGTVRCKHWLMGAITTSATKEPDERSIHFSEQLPPQYFYGLQTEMFRPETGRYAKKVGDDRDTPVARNEPLDLMCYAYAAIHNENLLWHKKGLERWPLPLSPGKPVEKKGFYIPD